MLQFYSDTVQYPQYLNLCPPRSRLPLLEQLVREPGGLAALHVVLRHHVARVRALSALT